MFKWPVWESWTNTSHQCGSCAWSPWHTSWSWSTSPPTSSSTALSLSSLRQYSTASASSVVLQPLLTQIRILKSVFWWIIWQSFLIPKLWRFIPVDSHASLKPATLPHATKCNLRPKINCFPLTTSKDKREIRFCNLVSMWFSQHCMVRKLSYLQDIF